MSLASRPCFALGVLSPVCEHALARKEKRPADDPFGHRPAREFANRFAARAPTREADNSLAAAREPSVDPPLRIASASRQAIDAFVLDRPDVRLKIE
jgi:hypothetical protein